MPSDLAARQNTRRFIRMTGTGPPGIAALQALSDLAFTTYGLSTKQVYDWALRRAIPYPHFRKTNCKRSAESGLTCTFAEID